MYVRFCFGWVFPCSSSIYCVPLCYIKDCTTHRIAPKSRTKCTLGCHSERIEESSVAKKQARYAPVSWMFRQAQHDDWVGHPHPKRKLIRSVLINGMCNFEDGIGAARRRPHRTPSLTKNTSDCAVLLATAWRTKRSGIIRGRYFSMRVPTVFPASDG